MKTKKIIGWILQIPLYLLVLGSFAASIYAAANNISGVTYVTPIILGIIIMIFIIGALLKKDKGDENENYKEDTSGLYGMEEPAQEYST